jgi:hypothetical protein
MDERGSSVSISQRIESDEPGKGEAMPMAKRFAPWTVLLVAGLVLAAGCKPPESGPDARLNEVQKLGEDEEVEELEQVVENESERLAIQAVVGLSRARRPRSRSRAREALYSVAGSDERPRVRQAAVQAISRTRQPEEQPRSREVLRRLARLDPDPRVRAEACDGLGDVGTLEDVQFLVDVATSPGQELMVESRAVAAIEDLLDIDFQYSSRASQSERRDALGRIKRIAPAIARKYMRYPRGRGGRNP